MNRNVVAWLAAAALGAGCYGQAHLREDHGRKTRAAFAAQRVHPEPHAGAPGGLDSEEAAIIHERYRTSLGAERPRGEDAGSKMLIIQEPKPEGKRDAPPR